MGVVQTTAEPPVSLPDNLIPEDLRRLLDSGVSQDYTPISHDYVARTTQDGRLEILARAAGPSTKPTVYSIEEVARVRAYLKNPWKDEDIPGI
ncbi:hypothetical protein HYV81_05235 [Candidatus Woesearchaeota archaeon]|nr:hypothetical protein [Candidatus Woesearchaeota archaeon]